MRKLLRLGLPATLTAGALTGAMVSLPAPADAALNGPPSGSIVVGTPGPFCPSPSTTSIQSAIDTAQAGQTIYVCPGTYDESLSIDKPLTLLGAGYGSDARFGRPAPLETVLTGSNGIDYLPGATSGTISGFTLEGYTGGRGEIIASNVGAGWTFTNNIIDASNGGIYLNTAGATDPAPSLIAHNRFVQATPSAADSGDFGQAVLLWANTANNVSISDNSFVNLSGPGAAINTTQAGDCGSAPDPASFGNNLKVTGNSFVDNGAPIPNSAYAVDENFLALFCTTGAQISGNRVTILDRNDANAVTPIYLGGGNWSTAVTGNILTGNGASYAAGVKLGVDFYPGGTGAVVSRNLISGFLYGIHVSGNSNFNVSGNLVLRSVGDGIRVDGTAAAGTVSSNIITGSATFDCFDSTTGSGTAGTANTWTHDLGRKSSPAGLCLP